MADGTREQEIAQRLEAVTVGPHPSSTDRGFYHHAPEDIAYLLQVVAGLREQLANRENRIDRINEDDSPGGLDEIVGYGFIHVERMDTGFVWASLAGHPFRFTSPSTRGKVVWDAENIARLRRAAVEVRKHEAPASRGVGERSSTDL